MNCPDQGLASIAAPSQQRVTVSGAFVAVASDQIAIAGCKLPAPHVKVEWPNLSTRVTVFGLRVMLQPLPTGPGAGSCVPAPAPPDIKLMQSRVTGM